ncbi:hypothetical protein NFI96_019968, partial [Prochilodus magdalenae]
NFIHKLDTLLSLFPVDDGSTLLLLGHFNYLTEVAINLPGPTAIILNPTPPTHRGSNLLELMFSRPTPALDKPLSLLCNRDTGLHVLSYFVGPCNGILLTPGGYLESELWGLILGRRSEQAQVYQVNKIHFTCPLDDSRPA